MSATANIEAVRIKKGPTVVTNTYQVLSTDVLVVCNKSTAFTVTLPVAALNMRFDIKNIGVGVVTLIGSPGTDTIDGETSQTISQWENITVQCSAANTWLIL